VTDHLVENERFDVLTLDTPSGLQRLRVVRVGKEFCLRTMNGSTYYLSEFNTNAMILENNIVEEFAQW
jgi:hypothetical protein